MPETETKVAAPVSEVIVTGRPVDAGGPTPEGKKRADFMNAFEAKKAADYSSIYDRLADSGIGYYDDNTANKRYIAALDFAEQQTPIGTPMHQVRKLNWPTDEEARLGQLEGVHVLREDGTFYSIPPGTRSLGDVVDPDSGERLVGDADPAKAKARARAALGTGEALPEEDKAEKDAEKEARKAEKDAEKAAKKSTKSKAKK